MTHFNFDINYLKLVSDFTDLRSQSHTTAIISDASHKYGVPSKPTFLSNVATNQEFPRSHLQVLKFARLAHRTQESVANSPAVTAFYFPWFHLLLFFSCTVVSNSLQPHGLHHARLPCPSQSPGVCSN